MALPILVLPAATLESLPVDLSAPAAARSRPVLAQSTLSDRDRLIGMWRRLPRLSRRRASTSQEQAIWRTTALPASSPIASQELLGDCERLMRLLLRRAGARLSHSHRWAIRRASRRFELHSATIRVTPAHADAAAWLLAAMHWWGCRHPGALECKPLHPPTGIVRWLAGFELSRQVDHPREVLSMLPQSMALIERRSRQIVADMIRRQGVVALLPELLR
ncbi:hypothetical protein [Variovorax guangxiensis]|uniref:hypothetical protein n=1 Tax=Variovorax guangxiensis TaxID=1775474 RepID=UPI002862E0A4|nr:hypothetical protein [Variovorax guangxiensis]MDR6861318.1 hypothetical protein [Variovorax guangxiensis]